MPRGEFANDTVPGPGGGGSDLGEVTKDRAECSGRATRSLWRDQEGGFIRKFGKSFAVRAVMSGGGGGFFFAE